MSRYRKLLLAITGSAILAVLGVSTSLAVAGHITSSQLARHEGQPFYAEVPLTITSTATTTPCVDDVVGVGTGSADPIGDVSVEGRVLILRRGRCNAVPGQPVAVGHDIFTVTNGDRLFATHHVTFVGVQPDGTLLWSGTFSFSGGTGQFAGATGGGDLTLTFLPPPAQAGTAVFDGQITLAADSK